MKVVLALVALVAVGTQAFVVPHNEAVVLSSNLITKLLTKAFEYARTILTENDPIDIPDLAAMTITDDDVDMTVQLSDVKLGNASDFEVTTLEASLSAMNATFEIFLPSLYLEGNHYVNGTAWDAEVYGDGTFTVEVTNFTQAGQVQFTVVDSSLQIETLDLQYDVVAVEFTVTGLESSVLDNDEIVAYLNDELLTTLKEHETFVCEKVSNHVVSIVNELMTGKSLLDVINWLKSAISS